MQRASRPDPTGAWHGSDQAGGVRVQSADGFPGVVSVRDSGTPHDSRNPHGPAPLFTAPAWTAFLGRTVTG
ncbi:DUF397 domain-containing protein [Streptomyces sp. NPDC101181]|uniref:DUF397 domain-containing protein n=1 Tax=Streptomyces sp. NPDC101181 TaxID=3366125 RepID=UPI0038024231